MNRIPIFIITILIASSFSSSAQEEVYNSTVRNRLREIKQGMDTVLFVRRFESVETPCVCIDMTNDGYSDHRRNIINSNYRARLRKDHVIDSGVQCLSKYYSRYIKFSEISYDANNLELSGRVEFTYGYPASSIIQYLGFTYTLPNRQDYFFNALMRSTGRFRLYPEKDKYRLAVGLTSGPYNRRDSFYAYIELVKEVYRPNPRTAYVIYFEEMSLHKGDKNNQIFLKFNSTIFRDEALYYSVLVYNDLKYINSTDQDKRASAIWLRSFFNNPGCPQCRYIYSQAELMVNGGAFLLPNTEPLPAH